MDLLDNIKHTKIHIIEGPKKGRQREKEGKNFTVSNICRLKISMEA